MAGEDNGVGEVLAKTGGAGAERVSVAAPSKQAQQAALEMAAKRARVVYFAGLPKHDPVSPLDMNQLHYKELAILGAYGATHRQYRITMDYLDRRQEDLARVVTHRFPLEEIARGVRDDPLRVGPEDGHPAVTGPYVIGCDVGRQGTNCALYAADGTLVASSYQAYDLSFPFPGAAEQDPDAWPAAVVAGVRELLDEVPEGPSAVKGLSFGSQLDGMVVCDADGRPAAPGDDLDGPARRGAGGGGRRADVARRLLPPRRARTWTPRTRSSRPCGSATRSPRSGRRRPR